MSSLLPTQHASESHRDEVVPRLAGYHNLELIGEGAMGKVYYAQHIEREDAVAIKVLRAELACSESHVLRFEAEANVGRRVGGDHVARVLDLVCDPAGHTYFVMDLLEGVDLATLWSARELSLMHRLAIVRKLCVAVTAVHEAGIVHRDLKPENVFVSTRGGKEVVKILDFGLAQVPRAPVQSSEPAEPGLLEGTPAYMAPEQAACGEADARSDIYALGVILFETITGRLPFQERHVGSLLLDIVGSSAPLVSQLVRLPKAVREELDGVVFECLQKAPNRRPQSADELGRALSRIISRLHHRQHTRTSSSSLRSRSWHSSRLAGRRSRGSLGKHPESHRLHR